MQIIIAKLMKIIIEKFVYIYIHIDIENYLDTHRKIIKIDIGKLYRQIQNNYRDRYRKIIQINIEKLYRQIWKIIQIYIERPRDRQFDREIDRYRKIIQIDSSIQKQIDI